jgi:hypothetical protein
MKVYWSLKQLLDMEIRDLSNKEINRIWWEYHRSEVSFKIIATFLSAPLLGAIGAAVTGLLGFSAGIGGLTGGLIGMEVFNQMRISDIASRIRNGEIQLNH